MLNSIALMGRITKDLELRYTPSGKAVCQFSIACERDYAPAGAEKEVDFFNIVTWDKVAEFVHRYFGKGRMIAIHGRLQVRTWVGKDNKKNYTTEIVASSAYFADSKPANQAAPTETSDDFTPVEDDDLPY